MIEKILWSIFAIYQVLSRGETTAFKPSFPSDSTSPVPTKYSLNRTGSKFKGFEHDNYSKTYHSYIQNSYTLSKPKPSQIQKNIKPKVSKHRIIPQPSINDDTFGSISISGLFHSIIVLILSVIGTCVFLDYQQRKRQNVNTSLPTHNTQNINAPSTQTTQTTQTTQNINTQNAQHINAQNINTINASLQSLQSMQSMQSMQHIIRPLVNTDRRSNYSQSMQSMQHINKPKPLFNTQILIDYDDTLFPTSYTNNNIENGITNSKQINKTDWFLLYEIRNNVYELLLILIKLFGPNNICIVSNAQMQWLENSCKIYNGLFQKIRTLVDIYNIRVISATDEYNSSKSKAFMSVLKDKYSINKVICIGDSLQEYNDIETVCNVLRLRRRRSRVDIINYYRFKLIDTPTLKTMIKELKYIKELNYYKIANQRYDTSQKYN